LRKIVGVLMIAVMFALGGIVSSAPVGMAAPRERCFVEVPFCIREPFLRYWEANGGLPVFGFPISERIENETVEGSWVGPTQWFERDRLEDHGSQGVMAGRMGARILELQGRPWQYGPGWTDVGCEYFEVTRYALCGGFLQYWKTNGGLARFGYPITTELTEKIGNWTGQVQYFERRRMEFHPEHNGTPYAILLGRLASDIKDHYSAPVTCTRQLSDDADIRAFALRVAFRDRLGCPTTHKTVESVVQTFANGRMLWLHPGAGDAHSADIYATYSSTIEPGTPTVYQRFVDDWTSGVDPEVYVAGNASVVPIEYPVVRGFGKVYYRAFRRGPIGIVPALTPERSQPAIVQRFTSGVVIVKLMTDRVVYGFGPARTDAPMWLPGR
jgi:hypothetical protein